MIVATIRQYESMEIAFENVFLVVMAFMGRSFFKATGVSEIKSLVAKMQAEGEAEEREYRVNN
jgi:hypothetical protein